MTEGNTQSEALAQLAREAVLAPTLEVFSARLDGVPRSTSWWVATS